TGLVPQGAAPKGALLLYAGGLRRSPRPAHIFLAAKTPLREPWNAPSVIGQTIGGKFHRGFRRHPVYIWTIAEDRPNGTKRPGKMQIIGPDPAHDRGIRLAESFGNSVVGPFVRLRNPIMQLARALLDDIDRPVGRTTVDHRVLQTRIALIQYRGHTGA